MDSTAISKRITIIEKLKQEKQTTKDMIDDALVNNDEYRKLEMEADALRDDLKSKRSEILALESNEKVVSKMKEIAGDLKEEQEILVEELIEYYRQTQKTEILSNDGKKMKLKFSARLIPLEY
ncbi:MAG: hypothetical protein ACD_83C00279G0001 [uncultured bacterium]|uniref:Uncharacterized protein n=1 Tax=Berkelbacteria bacterium GW2011_GWA2_38_9 TaxID=1618334 RepID=A0A0G0L8U8_9BACT|nr:MAG: hypothetical protein ACD_83C00279G0001 [uncultured bacterium]KKQ87427.1 MAG: hypothetical protein UT11_C0053G0004 [Berkelbacteria bacterium GW2011_GWA2_38_9]